MHPALSHTAPAHTAPREPESRLADVSVPFASLWPRMNAARNASKLGAEQDAEAPNTEVSGVNVSPRRQRPVQAFVSEPSTDPARHLAKTIRPPGPIPSASSIRPSIQLERRSRSRSARLRWGLRVAVALSAAGVGAATARFTGSHIAPAAGHAGDPIAKRRLEQHIGLVSQLPAPAEAPSTTMRP